jgi:putative aldouronate transport system permease protein
MAILLSELGSRAFKKIAQSFMFLPYFVSYVILSVLVYNIFNYETGVLNSVLVGLGMERVDLYSMPGAWRYILVTFHVWKWLGHGSVIYLAAIMTIDESLYEAADIDGANMLQKVFRITLPALKPTIAILLLLAVGRIMRGQFELFYQIVGTNGQLYQTTDIIDTFVFRSLVKTFDISMGTAAGLYQSVMGLGIILITNFIVKRLNPEYALF